MMALRTLITDRLFTVPALPDGPHTLRYRSYDNVYNVSSDHTQPFWVNQAPPSVTLAATALPSGAVQLTWSGSPDIEQVRIEVAPAGTGQWQPWTNTAASSLVFFGTPGTAYEFRLTASDGMYLGLSNITAPVMVPANAVFSWRFLPVLAR